MARRYYLDTSAYLSVLLGEKGHEAIEEEIAGAQLLSSSLLVLETTRNLVRYSREGLISAAGLQDRLARLEEDLKLFDLRNLTRDLCEGRVMPVVTTPRSLDLAHLRTALWFHAQERLSRFVTKDKDQALSARELGLPV